MGRAGAAAAHTAGEIDVLAERAGLLALVEVKARRNLALAAASVGVTQRMRLLAAAAIVLADHPDWGVAGVRFDVMMVDQAGCVRRIIDAFRKNKGMQDQCFRLVTLILRKYV